MEVVVIVGGGDWDCGFYGVELKRESGKKSGNLKVYVLCIDFFLCRWNINLM